jgi:hypothetical protein
MEEKLLRRIRELLGSQGQHGGQSDGVPAEWLSRRQLEHVKDPSDDWTERFSGSVVRREKLLYICADDGARRW